MTLDLEDIARNAELQIAFLDPAQVDATPLLAGFKIRGASIQKLRKLYKARFKHYTGKNL